MLSKARWTASLSLILICLLSSGATLARTKAAPAYNNNIQVLSTVEEPSGKTVQLNLSSQKALAAPVMQYRYDERGNSIVIFDFTGLVWPGETRYITPKSSPIQSVRIGQFQASPATLRIAATAKNAQALQNIAISYNKGVLKVKLPVSKSLEANISKLAPQPQPASQRIAQITSTNQPPPLAPSFSPAAAALRSQAQTLKTTPLQQTSKAPQFTQGGLFFNLSEQDPEDNNINQASNKQVTTANSPSLVLPQATSLPPAAPDFRNAQSTIPSALTKPPTSTDSEKSIQANQALPAEPLDWLHYQPSAPSRVVLDLKKASAYKTFRLSSPERIVIDVDGMEINGRAAPNPAAPNLSASPPATPGPAAPSLAAPSIEATNYLRAIRAGLPEPGTNKIRIVLDLANSNITMTEAFDETSRLLTLNLVPAVEITSAKGMVIVVDAGHGGSDPGAQRGDIQEKEITLGIANKLKKVLENKGARVVMTRSDDTFVSLADRVKITNEVKPDVFISVHINALETNQTIHGIETYYQTEQSRLLAESIHGNLVNLLEAPDRSVRKARFYVVNHTAVPAILAEVGFISNKEERDKLISSEYQTKVAESLSRGVMLYLANRDGGNDTNKIASSLENSKFKSLPKTSGQEKNHSNLSN